MLINNSIKSYLKDLSSDAPTPGGGSASAVVAAMGTGLLLMVGKIARKKLPKPEQVNLDKTIKLLTKCLKDIEEVVDLDVKVYQAVMAAYKKKETAKIEAALANSFRLQADLAFLIAMAKETLPTLFKVANGAIRNDLIVARAFLDGAFQGAVATARINVKYMAAAKRDHFGIALEALEKKYYGIKT